MLADMGAQVIKVEAPEGELVRYFPPYQYGSGSTFLQLNRGKRSLTTNLKTPAGREIVMRLLENTDVLLESFRPGVMRRFGLDYESLKVRFPSLVYCSITGYGQTGKDAVRPGHDVNYISMAGLLSLAGSLQKGLLIPPVQIADTLGGFQAGMAVCAALLQRFRTGRGQHIDVSLFAGALFTMIHVASLHFAGTQLNPGELPLSGKLAGYNVYRTRDNRFLALGFVEPKFWESFCLKMDLDRFANHQLQSDQTDLIRVLQEKFSTRTMDEWMQIFQSNDLCVTPVRNVQEVFSDPSLRQSGHIMNVEYPSGSLMQMKTPFVREELNTKRSPLLGEHNVEILLEAGYSASEIEGFKKDGVL